MTTTTNTLLTSEISKLCVFSVLQEPGDVGLWKACEHVLNLKETQMNRSFITMLQTICELHEFLAPRLPPAGRGHLNQQAGSAPKEALARCTLYCVSTHTDSRMN